MHSGLAAEGWANRSFSQRTKTNASTADDPDIGGSRECWFKRRTFVRNEFAQ